MDWMTPDITTLVYAALEEDLGALRDFTGDLSANAIAPADASCRAAIYAKQTAILAGIPMAQRVFKALDANAICEAPVAEGAAVEAGTLVLRIEGCARSILSAERTALNFLAHLSGVATFTRKFVDAIAGTPATIRDTRKTFPLQRALEKYAVRMGGGVNHRFGLYDAILIKENHVAIAGSIGEAIRRAKALVALRESSFPETTAYESFEPRTGNKPIQIQVEVRDEAELREALAAGALSVLLDNQTPAGAARLVQIARQSTPACTVEISGGVSLNNVRAYAESGADFIAIGAITHSAPAADFSLLVEK